jgi:hypothetical protein
MAAARDRAARILRAEPDAAEGGFAREVSADSPRSPVSEETVARRSAESPGNPAIEKPATGKPPGRTRPPSNQSYAPAENFSTVLFSPVSIRSPRVRSGAAVSLARATFTSTSFYSVPRGVIFKKFWRKNTVNSKT